MGLDLGDIFLSLKKNSWEGGRSFCRLGGVLSHDHYRDGHVIDRYVGYKLSFNCNYRSSSIE